MKTKTTEGLKTHWLFASRDGDTLRDFQGLQGKRTDPKAVAIEILRDRGRYRVGEYVVVETDWTYDLPGFDADRGSDFTLTPQVEAVVKVVTITVGHEDFRKSA